MAKSDVTVLTKLENGLGVRIITEAGQIKSRLLDCPRKVSV
jgi:hypothetical protein